MDDNNNDIDNTGAARNDTAAVVKNMHVAGIESGDKTLENGHDVDTNVTGNKKVERGADFNKKDNVTEGKEGVNDRNKAKDDHDVSNGPVATAPSRGISKPLHGILSQSKHANGEFSSDTPTKESAGDSKEPGKTLMSCYNGNYKPLSKFKSYYPKCALPWGIRRWMELAGKTFGESLSINTMLFLYELANNESLLSIPTYCNITL
jgi:hypothetical protein